MTVTSGVRLVAKTGVTIRRTHRELSKTTNERNLADQRGSTAVIERTAGLFMLIIAPWLFYVRALPIRLPDIFIQSGPVKVRYILNVSITADLLSLHHVTRTNLAHFQDATNQKRRFKSTTPRYQTRTNKPADQIALTY